MLHRIVLKQLYTVRTIEMPKSRVCLADCVQEVQVESLNFVRCSSFLFEHTVILRLVCAKPLVLYIHNEGSKPCTQGCNVSDEIQIGI